MVDFVCLFFKHKTAYEMRISDWSSDVCSSDLFPELQEGVRVLVTVDQSIDGARLHRLAGALCARLARLRRLVVLEGMRALARRPRVQPGIPTRSEEHTSELQSLMRISYAVFCLKKKIQQTTL